MGGARTPTLPPEDARPGVRPARTPQKNSQLRLPPREKHAPPGNTPVLSGSAECPVPARGSPEPGSTATPRSPPTFSLGPPEGGDPGESRPRLARFEFFFFYSGWQAERRGARLVSKAGPEPNEQNSEKKAERRRPPHADGAVTALAGATARMCSYRNSRRRGACARPAPRLVRAPPSQ